MLEELRIENLLLLDEAQLRLARGLNVVTGETGAGKTLLAGALDLLLGGRARRGIVRPGAKEAYVEGIFALPQSLSGHERLPAGAQEIVLARRVWADGRTRAYLCGRSLTVEELRELGGALLSFYGQHEHRKLMLAAAQLNILDARCGPAQREARRRAAAAHQRVRALEARVRELRDLAGARERDLDLLAYELSEIEAVAPSEEEREALHARRERLRHLEALCGAAAGIAQAIDDEEHGAAARLAHAARLLEGAAALDSSLAGALDRLQVARIECEELSRELGDYALSLEASADGGSAALEQLEERLETIARLERKHGGNVAQVLAHAERCRTRIAELEGAEVVLEEETAELERARCELETVAGELRRRRVEMAPRLARAVQERLSELAMGDARFDVRVSERSDQPGPAGADSVELMIATNSGVPLGPLREVASGGELSRVMLALLGVAHGDPEAGSEPGEAPLLVFDEIDAGIGGHTAHAVGDHLRALASGRQVLCITHLPQVAALADRHFTIAKDARTAPPRTTVEALEDDAVVGELVRMLGAAESDLGAAQHARALLRAA